MNLPTLLPHGTLPFLTLFPFTVGEQTGRLSGNLPFPLCNFFWQPFHVRMPPRPGGSCRTHGPAGFSPQASVSGRTRLVLMCRCPRRACTRSCTRCSAVPHVLSTPACCPMAPGPAVLCGGCQVSQSRAAVGLRGACWRNQSGCALEDPVFCGCG